MAFADVMLEQLFAEIWTREALSIRDRRLVLLGIIGALGERDTFQIQVKAALKNGELTAEQVREIVITLAQYAGYPRAAAQIGGTEQTIAAVAKELKEKQGA
jgi:4-carboxymuconolactone decarboxylase